MKHIRPILVLTVALLSACAKSPTTSATPGSARHDGGNSMGSGNSVPTDSSQRGGNSLGSGN